MSPNRLHWLRACVMIGALVLVAGAFVLAGQPARAFNSLLTAAKSQYPTIVGTSLASCTLCHVSASDSGFNPYGRAYSNAGESFTAIENRDSDGDGFTNIVEINAHTFPGNAGSKPAAPATATPTRVPATATRVATATTVPPTATATAVPPTATATTVPPTATATAVPPTATATAVPPTATATTVPPTATATEAPPTATATLVGELPTATATATEAPPTLEPTATASATPTATVELPRLGLAVTADRDVMPASWIIRFTIVVTNESDIALPEIVVSDPLPQGTWFVRALNGGELVDGEVIWRLVDVPAGARRVLYVQLWTNSTYRGIVNNVVTATANGVSVSAGKVVQVVGLVGRPRDD